MYVMKATIDMFLRAVEMIVIMRCFASFVVRDMPMGGFMYHLYRISDPIMKPARDLLERLNINTGMIDFSPILVFIAIRLLRGVLL